MIKNVSELYAYRELKTKELSQKAAEGKRYITVCNGTGCHAYGCTKVTNALEEEIKKQGLEGKLEVIPTGCHGFCEKGTLVVVRDSILNHEGVLYTKVKPEHAAEVVEKISKKEIVEELLYKDCNDNRIEQENDVPFYSKQMRIVFGMNGMINPESIDSYIINSGYFSLVAALQKSPEFIIEEIKKSGLRGRGGAGFPTGKKWEATRKSKESPKYIICNADEGDPGAYMDRSLLEGNPHSVIEGMIIGAYAIGASEGIVYVRHEYPLAYKNLKKAIADAKSLGLLGENILGRGLNFDIKVVGGGGAFVCGEETALIASVENKAGEPRMKPPFPAEKGLHGKPTNINNVETWANVPIIIDKGSGWYSSIGTETSKGTKIFSLVGKVNNTGLVEVPMGTTLREIVFGIGGGVKKNRKFKAVQIGGPSGGCIPESLIDTPVDYESLKKAGAMMGSGGLIVMDEGTCMVDIARYFTNFLKDESCGKCVSCREGLEQMSIILENICKGKGKKQDLKLLEELAYYIKEASQCGLGNTASNPVLTTLAYFKNEYLEHITGKKCHAGVCKELTTYFIDANSCKGCGACKEACPQGAISGEKKKPFALDNEKCIKCGVCTSACKFDAIKPE